MSLFRRIVNWNVRASARFDRLLPGSFTTDGNRFFVDTFFLRFLEPHQRVVDLGGGRHPAISLDVKQKRELEVIGIDISEEELDLAPDGAYDRKICADVTRYEGDGIADVVICQSLLEHVQSTDHAFHAIATSLKVNGVALLFAPSRNAVFARINLILPERMKRAVLFALYPSARGSQGFLSYYDRCTPLQFEKMAGDHGLEVVERHLFFSSSYFTFFLPAHILWRIWMVIFHAMAPVQSAETFVYALRRVSVDSVAHT